LARKLNSLIRLHKWRVDEKRRHLGELLRLVEDLENRARRLEEELRNEQKIAGAAPREAGYLYGQYAQAVIRRRGQIAQAIAETEKGIAAAREALNEAYRNLKKYEVAQAGRDTRETRERDHREQIVLDELGIQAYTQRRR